MNGMKNPLRLVIGLAGFAVLCAPVAFASAQSVSIQSLSPGATSPAKEKLTFSIVPSGFTSPSFQLSDSFSGSSASASNIDPVGHFLWVPLVSDVGSHTFSITVVDNSGDTANTTQTITVVSAPSVAIQSVSPGNAVMPGTKLSFTVSTPGFTNPSYIVGDSFSGSSVSDADVDSSGNFSWTPLVSDDGSHTITIYANDSLGHSSSASITIQAGVGPTLTVGSLAPGASVTAGQVVTFSTVASNYSPTGFTVTDSLPGSTISGTNINTTGNFSWSPQPGDVGVHVLKITGIVGAYGTSASTTQTITILGPGGTLPPAPAPTTASTSTTSGISALQAQLAALQAQIAGQSGSGAPSASGSGTFNIYLYPGINDTTDVTALQAALAQLGFFSATPNGLYGPVTTTAVKAFQKAHGLAQLGVVGPATRAALNALGTGGTASANTTSSSSSATGDGYVFKNFMGLGEDQTDGTDVLELQKRLATLGYFTATPTGTFGPTTEAAVIQFQTAKGITPTGYVGSITRAALNQ